MDGNCRLCIAQRIDSLGNDAFARSTSCNGTALSVCRCIDRDKYGAAFAVTTLVVVFKFTVALPFVVLLFAALLLGGIYTIILIPVAVVLAIGTTAYAMYKRSSERADIPGERERVRPLPHTGHGNTAASPTTPQQLVDAQRQQQ